MAFDIQPPKKKQPRQQPTTPAQPVRQQPAQKKQASTKTKQPKKKKQTKSILKSLVFVCLLLAIGSGVWAFATGRIALPDMSTTEKEPSSGIVTKFADDNPADTDPQEDVVAPETQDPLQQAHQQYSSYVANVPLGTSTPPGIDRREMQLLSSYIQEFDVSETTPPQLTDSLDERGQFLAAQNAYAESSSSENEEQLYITAQEWGGQLVSRQLDYIEQIEKDLYGRLQVQAELPENWLETQRSLLLTMLDSIADASDYETIQDLMQENATIWQQTISAIDDMRAWLVFDTYHIALLQARAIQQAVTQAQTEVQSQLDAQGASTDWSLWTQVHETYTDKLNALETDFVATRGDFSDLPYTDLNASDEAWQQAQVRMQSWKSDFETLELLQAESIAQFLNVYEQVAAE